MGTISDKLVYLDGTREQIKENLNKFGSNITENDTFRSYANVLSDIYDTLPKVSANGTEFTLENAQNGKLDSFGMDGNTEQTTYTGKNLLNPYEYNTPTEKNGITCTYDAKDQSYTFNGTCTADNTSFEIGAKKISFTNGITTVSAYLISGSVSNYCVFRTFDVNFGRNTPIDLTNLSSNNPIIYATCNGTNYTATYISLRFQEGSIANNLKVKFMIADSTDTTYEPYVGETPSPNPDYPQNINVVSGNQVVNVSGKNLFDIQSLVKGRLDDGIIGYANNTTDITLNDNSFSFTTNANYRGVTSDFIKAEPNVDYIVSAEDISGVTTLCACYDSNKVWLGNTSTINIDSKSKKYTTLNNTAYIRVSYQLASSGTITVTNLQIEEGSTATSYEPYYTPQNYTIGLGSMELCKIGDYQDVIFKNNQLSEYYDSTLDEDGWYIKKEIGKVVLDGSESWVLAQTNTNTLRFNCSNGLINGLDINTLKIISNNFVNGISASDNSDNEHIRSGVLGYPEMVAICINKTRLSSQNVEDFKTWLSTHNVEVYYVLSTPTYEKITDETLITQLEAIKVFTGSNYFTLSNSNNVLPNIYAKRLKKLDSLT